MILVVLAIGSSRSAALLRERLTRPLVHHDIGAPLDGGGARAPAGRAPRRRHGGEYREPAEHGRILAGPPPPRPRRPGDPAPAVSVVERVRPPRRHREEPSDRHGPARPRQDRPAAARRPAGALHPGGTARGPRRDGGARQRRGPVRRARRVGAHIVHVRHVGDHPLFEDFREGSPGFAIRPEVAPAEGEPVIDKRGPSAFDGTQLEDAGGPQRRGRGRRGLHLPHPLHRDRPGGPRAPTTAPVAADATAADPHGGDAATRRCTPAPSPSSGAWAPKSSPAETIKSLLGGYE